MLAFVLETFKDLLTIEESLDCIGLKVSEETVRVPDSGNPGVEQEPSKALHLPGVEQDLTEHLATQSNTPPTHSTSWTRLKRLKDTIIDGRIMQ